MIMYKVESVGHLLALDVNYFEQIING